MADQAQGTRFSRIKIGATFTTSKGETFTKHDELIYTDAVGIEHYWDPFFDRTVGEEIVPGKPVVDTSAHVVGTKVCPTCQGTGKV